MAAGAALRRKGVRVNLPDVGKEEGVDMVDKRDPKVLKHVVRSLRLRTGMKGKEFGKACRVDQASISRYELGKAAPPEESLRRMAATARVPWHLVVSMIRFFTDLLSAADRGTAPASPAEPPPVERAILDSIALAVAPYLIEEGLAAAEGLPPEQALREAREVCAGLLPLPAADRRRLLGLSVQASRSWAVAAELAHASERAAADDVEEARELAELALYVARRVPEKDQRVRTEGYCTGFLSNVERVATDFDQAGEVFSEAWELWRAGEAAASLPLAEWRLLDLEASLRRAQHRFPQALERLKRALALCGGGALATGRLLTKKANVLQQMGDYAGALEVLEEAKPTIETAGDPQLVFALRFNTAVNLVYLERYSEAEELLPSVREMASEQNRQLESLRVLWLSAKISAGRGRVEEAMHGLEQVVREFTDLPLPYEAALAALDLAVLYLEAGRTTEVKALAETMGSIFKAKGITREALAALSCFCEAAQQEIATVALAKRVIAELEKAQRSASPS
jgi:tetratricopeptide (TPR) repeat protein